MIKQKIGFIGVGNMGESILNGLVVRKMIEPSACFIFDKLSQRVEEVRSRLGVSVATSNESLTKEVDVVILAVKPQDLQVTLSEIKSALSKDAVVISILAGTSITKIKKHIGDDVRVVRTMPNLGAKVGEGVTAICAPDASSREVAEAIFSGCGRTIAIEEEYFDLVTAVSGSGPAYFFLLMEMLMRAATSRGLSEEQAKILAVQTALGASRLVANDDKVNPEVWRQRVTSKGGTTAAALEALEAGKFSTIFDDAIEAAINRGRELDQD